jgi:hypothetical protein
MPRHQCGKGLVGIIFRVLPQQCIVVRGFHSRISVRLPPKTDNLFTAIHLVLADEARCFTKS